MDLVKTKCKQKNENHITEDITVIQIGKDRQIKLNIGKTFFNAIGMAMPRLEMRRISCLLRLYHCFQKIFQFW
jgi:hypothetical protein